MGFCRDIVFNDMTYIDAYRNNYNVSEKTKGNSLRAMMIEIGMYKPKDISSIELPTGLPLCINFNKLKLIDFYYLD